MDLAKIFCDLVSTPSPSGKERRVAMKIKGYLDSMKVSNYIDGSAKRAKGDVGNLIASIGSGNPKLLFVSHMDTVEDGVAPIIPVIKNGMIRPKGKTILGADDKSGCSSMLKAIESLRDVHDLPKTTFIFTTNEESGMAAMGVECIKIKDGADYAFSIDGSNRPGIFFNKALGTEVFEVWIKGKAAHAESVPHKGANAVRACGLILSNLVIGKSRADGSMLNVGKIEGGGTTTAVVPDNAHLIGEFGAFDRMKMNKITEHIKSVVGSACTKTGCSYKIRFYTESVSPPFKKDMRDKQIVLAKRAAVAAGLNFSLATLDATSEVNMLAGMGYSSLGMCRGGRNAHSTKEYLTIKEMEDTARLIAQIVKEAKTLKK